MSKSIHMRPFAYVSSFAYTQINTRVSNDVGFLTFMSRKNSCSSELSIKKTSGPGVCSYGKSPLSHLRNIVMGI